MFETENGSFRCELQPADLSEDHNDKRNMSIRFERQEESIARHFSRMTTEMKEELATQMTTLKEEMVTQMRTQMKEMTTQIIKETTTQIQTIKLQMEKMFAAQERLIQELHSNKDPREKTQNRQISPHSKRHNGQIDQESSDTTVAAATPGGTHSNSSGSTENPLLEQTAPETTEAARLEIIFKKGAKTVNEVANEYFFNEHCIRNLEKQCKAKGIKCAKSNAQRQYIFRTKPLVSYIELKVDPHTPEGKELINDLEHCRKLKNLTLRQMSMHLRETSIQDIDSIVELAREQRASKRQKT